MEMYLDAEIERVWISTLRPCSFEMEGVFGDG